MVDLLLSSALGVSAETSAPLQEPVWAGSCFLYIFGVEQKARMRGGLGVVFAPVYSKSSDCGWLWKGDSSYL
jgi:hypothetical protein